MSIELLQVMSAFYARFAMKVIELLSWYLVWFGEEFGVHAAVVLVWSQIVRSSFTWSNSTSSVYESRLDRLKCWKTQRNRQTEIYDHLWKRVDRLKSRAFLIDRLKLLVRHTPSKLDRLKLLEGLQKADCNRIKGSQPPRVDSRLDRLKLLEGRRLVRLKMLKQG